MGQQREKRHLKSSPFAASVTRNHSYFSVCSSFYLSNFLTCFILIHLFASLFRFWSVIFLLFFWSSFLLVLFSPLLPFLSFLFLLKKPSAVSIVSSKREGSTSDSHFSATNAGARKKLILPLCLRSRETWPKSRGLFLESSETFRAIFGWHNCLYIFKTKASTKY